MGTEWGGDGNGEISYEQPGTKEDGILSQQGGFQLSKGKWKGEQKARGLRRNYVVSLHACT